MNLAQMNNKGGYSLDDKKFWLNGNSIFDFFSILIPGVCSGCLI